MSFLPFGRTTTKPTATKTDKTPVTTDAAVETPVRFSQTSPYTVRVRSSFKGEVIALLTELQAERLNKHGATRRVTEREMMELMLDAYKAVRRNNGASGYASPLPEEVWLGVQAIGKEMGCSPAEAVESLVVEKLEALGLAGRKTKGAIA